MLDALAARNIGPCRLRPVYQMQARLMTLHPQSDFPPLIRAHRSGLETTLSKYHALTE
jgi:hypothetical protein